jgi:hypothetical protein
MFAKLRELIIEENISCCEDPLKMSLKVSLKEILKFYFDP